MWKFIVRRLITTLPQIILLSALVFIMAKLMPGDALTGLIDPSLDPATIAEQSNDHHRSNRRNRAR